MTCVTRDGRISPGCTGMYLPEHVPAWRAHRRLRARALAREDLPAARPLRAERLDQAHVGGNGRAARRGELAGRRAVGDPVCARESDSARADARGDGRDSRGLRARRRDGRRSGFRHARTALRARLSCCRRSSRRCATGAPTSTAARSKTDCAIRSKCLRRCAPSGRAERPMSVRISATDWVDGGISGDDSVEIARAFKDAGADLDRRLDRVKPRPTPSPSTAACFKRRTPTRFATKSASRRWPSATSPTPIRSTPS